MPWRLGIVAALLAWLFLPGPAAAAIQRSTDSRGVIHISNVPAKPAPSHSDNPAAHPCPEATISRPEPAASAALEVSQSREAAAVNLQAALAATEKVCRGLANGDIEPPAQTIDQIIAAAALAAATVETEVTTPQLPLKKVAYEPTAAETAPAPQAATPKAGETITAGGIHRYKDARGVWHITNLAPAMEPAAPAILEAENRRGPGSTASPEKLVSRPAAPESGLPLKKVSWSPDNPDRSDLPLRVAAARTAVPGTAAPIRRYRDHKGVIHIDNVGAAPEYLPPPGVQARAGPGDGDRSPGRRQPPPPVMAAGTPLPLKPVSWSGEDGLRPLRPWKAGASQRAEITTEGGIRRWRDKKGVWHIETVEYPLPPGVVLPPRQAGLIPGTREADVPPATGPPGVLAGAMQAPAPVYAALGTQVTAFRDRQGRLKITNKPEPLPGIGIPPMTGAPAPAALEPLIAEAAQVHRLPATLIRAVIKVESNFCSWAVSPKGAMGLMQLMPGTAAFLGVQEPFNPRENIHGGCRYLRLLIDCFGGSLPLALAAYNAGFQRVINSGYQVPGIKETQEFVTQVMGRYEAEEKARLPWT